MRTFVIRARKGTTRWERIRSHIGTQEHFEVIAHSVMNGFFTSNNFRQDVEMYIILESTEDFPRTIKLSGNEGLSIPGFHEDAIIQLIEKALQESSDLKKNETKCLAPGLHIMGYGFEKCVQQLLEVKPVYLLDPKGSDIRSIELDENSAFILSDHLTMPKNSIKGLKRRGVNSLSLGKKMLFASQCVVLINHEFDRN